MLKSLMTLRENLRQEAIDKAKKYLDSLGLKKYQAILFGSFSKGDFNEASDIDLLIISDELPENLNDRLSFLNQKRWETPEVEPIGWTEKEYAIRRKKNDPFIGLLEKEGIVISQNK